MTEEWRDIEGMEGMYQISNMGNVRGLNRKAYVHENANGYVQAVLRVPGKPDQFAYVHRLVAAAFIPCDDPEKIEVHHIDRDKHNNCVDNLRWVTLRENRGDAWKDRSVPHSFTMPEKRMIVELYRLGKGGKSISKISGIGKNRIFEFLKEAKEDGII